MAGVGAGVVTVSDDLNRTPAAVGDDDRLAAAGGFGCDGCWLLLLFNVIGHDRGRSCEGGTVDRAFRALLKGVARRAVGLFVVPIALEAQIEIGVLDTLEAGAVDGLIGCQLSPFVFSLSPALSFSHQKGHKEWGGRTV